MTDLCDSDRNILAGLRHEACENHCAECGRCDWESTGPDTIRTVPMHAVDHGHSIAYYCDNCAPSPDEPCAWCDQPVTPTPFGQSGHTRWAFTLDVDGDYPCHEECFNEARDAAGEARAEARADERRYR